MSDNDKNNNYEDIIKKENEKMYEPPSYKWFLAVIALSSAIGIKVTNVQCFLLLSSSGDIIKVMEDENFGCKYKKMSTFL